MKTALFALAASVLLAAPSWAGPRPYVLHNGRHVGGGGGSRTFSPPASRTSGGGFVHASGGASAFGTRAVRVSGFSGGGSSGGGARSFGSSSRHSSYAYFHPLRFTHYVYRGIGAKAASGGSSGSSGGSSSKTPPPNYSKPGALIRTAGQQPKYAKASGARTHAVNGGGFVAANPADSHDVARTPGIAWGRPDTPPGANPAAGGNNGAAYNGPPVTINNSTTQNGASNNTNGNQTGGGNGNSPPSFPLSF